MKRNLNNSLKSVQSALESYLSSCNANGLAAGTIENYKKCVELFLNSANRHKRDLASVGAVNDWKIDLSETGKKITTIASYISMLRSFFDWAVKMEMIEYNPCIPTVMPSKKIVNAAKRRPYERILDASDFSRILHSGKPKGVSAETWPRNRAILILFMTTALRNSELRNLALNDLDFENGSIRVNHGKGDKMRITAFPAIAQEAVKEYLQSGYRKRNLAATNYLFGVYGGKNNNKWTQMERNSLSQLVERNIKLITGKDGYKTHALRHCAATQYYDRGLDVGSISDLLGHSNVQTTQIYIEKLRPSLPSQKANDLFADERNVKFV